MDKNFAYSRKKISFLVKVVMSWNYRFGLVRTKTTVAETKVKITLVLFFKTDKRYKTIRI